MQLTPEQKEASKLKSRLENAGLDKKDVEIIDKLLAEGWKLPKERLECLPALK